MRPPNAAPTSSFLEFQGLEHSRPCCLPCFPCHGPRRAFRTPGRRPWQGRGTGAELRPPLSSPTCPQPHPASQTVVPIASSSPWAEPGGTPSNGTVFLLLLPLAPSPAPASTLSPARHVSRVSCGARHPGPVLCLAPWPLSPSEPCRLPPGHPSHLGLCHLQGRPGPAGVC